MNLDLQRYRISRRQFFKWGGAGTLVSALAPRAFAVPPSWKRPGSAFSNYGQPAQHQQHVIRWISSNPAVAGDGVSWTPLHELEGTITPNGLHFERHHNGVPDIKGADWSLTIHGLVNQPLQFDLQQLLRYPMHSRVCFIECGGNSNSLWRDPPQQVAAGHLHGLVSGCEWTGVSLSLLLKEAGLRADAKWVVADGLDASGVTVSLPLPKCLDDVILAVYQNGEALRPENGFPVRLLVPGWEGIVNIKWLRSLQLSDRPLWSKFDTVSYTDLQPDGKAQRLTYEMAVKSVITSPALSADALPAGFHEISGLAWSGAGRIHRVDVSVDNGQSWQPAQLQDPVLDKALTRFRYPWQWHKMPTVIMSRASDEKGNVQPTRTQLLAEMGQNAYHHYNAIVALAVSGEGRVSHVYS